MVKTVTRVYEFSTMENTSLKGKRVVVTGGSSGMGLATAKAAAKAGAEVTILARRKEALAKAVAEIGNGAKSLTLDVGNEEAVNTCFHELGPIDHLITAAAGNVVGTIAGVDIKSAREFFEGKFWGQYLCARAAAPKIRPGGSITLFSGAGARRVFPGFALVGTSEAAIEQLTKYLAQEYAPVRVNAVVPGVIDTPLTQSIPNWEAVRAATAAVLPVRRVGLAEDIAQAVLLVMTNTFMSASIVDVDGGHSVI